VLQSEEDLPSGETLHWADGFLLVYAITDRRSFNFVRRVKQMLCCDTPLALVGNKGDMVHLRQVSTEEGKIQQQHDMGLIWTYYLMFLDNC
jgi:Ras-like protein family protein 11A